MSDLKIDIDAGVAWVTVNRPEVRNTLRIETVEELRTTVEDLRKRPEAGAIVFTGAGDRAFIAGRDVHDLLKLGRADALEHRLSRLLQEIENLEKPTIAAVNGYALGGGLEFALACDLRIAADTAVFGLPETQLGIIPAAGGTQRLPRVVGVGIAKEMILTGKTLDARRAYEVGLVSEVVPSEKLTEAATGAARKILERGPLATRLAKMVLNLSSQTSLDAGLLIERLAQAVLFESRDKIEGATAFLEKRKPRFQGE